MPRPRIALVATTLLATLATSAAAQTFEARLRARNPMTSDIFSYDLALDGNTLISGAPFATIGGVQQPGRAFVFRYVNGAWNQGVELRPSIIQANAFFGVRVAASGNVVVAGAPSEDHAAVNAGAVYVFERSGGMWPEAARLVASDPVAEARFGGGLAIQGDTLLVGAGSDSNKNGQGAGAVYVFERIGGVWTEVDKLIASDGAAFDDFGLTIAMDGDTAVIGARDHTHSGQAEAGAAYVFVREGGVWNEQAKLVSPAPAADSLFGESLDVSGDTIVVGAHQHPHMNLSRSGAAWVYERAGTSWNMVAELTAADAASGDHFAVGVTIEGDTILSGAYLKSRPGGTGSVYVYRRGSEGWTFDTSFFTTDPGGVLFGWVVSLSGDRAAVAGPFYLTNQGALYTYTGLSQCDACDVNCDGAVDAFDIEPFVALLVDPNPAPCSPCAADANGDGVIDAFDIEPFVGCLTSP